eukprot:CAMPEP_0113530622 /NCGR_PEP_ID=MMETSP0015_2-20120614/3047_1 /TAXON_ID=2838 /ORGANISM="Odontella" /LENGTH=430 /DNA_ID=CAMNT_0000429375 /DNA_START=155 /DNA_END=1447 /DNA_ORIENTATION=- /assembly_acc=CAM_ASM_000160
MLLSSSSSSSSSSSRRRRGVVVVPAGASLAFFAFAFALVAPIGTICTASAFVPSLPPSAALPPHPASKSRTSLSMIGGLNLGGGGGSSSAKSEPTLPRDVKDAVSKCRQSVQEALAQRLSRMDVEFPVGTKFGVEKDSKGGGGKKKGGRLSGALGDDDSDGPVKGAPTRDQLDRSDRELARLFVDMFQPVGGENIAVCFNDEGLAENARKRWKDDSSAACRVLGIDRKGGGRKGGGGGAVAKGGMGGGMSKKKGGKGVRSRKKAGGFAAKMAAELEGDGNSGPFALPEKCEVALFVAPGPKELIAVERICDDAGMGTLVVLLNARLGNPSVHSKFSTERAARLFDDEFEPVFHLGAAPQEEAPGCLLHRAYPGDWIVARKPKVGPPKTIMVTEDRRPTSEDCRDAYDSVEIGDVERAAENVLENVAGWFK